LDGKRIYDALQDSAVTNFGDIAWRAVAMSLTGASIRSSSSAAINSNLTISGMALVKYFSLTTLSRSHAITIESHVVI